MHVYPRADHTKLRARLPSAVKWAKQLTQQACCAYVGLESLVAESEGALSFGIEVLRAGMTVPVVLQQCLGHQPQRQPHRAHAQPQRTGGLHCVPGRSGQKRQRLAAAAVEAPPVEATNGLAQQSGSGPRSPFSPSPSFQSHSVTLSTHAVSLISSSGPTAQHLIDAACLLLASGKWTCCCRRLSPEECTAIYRDMYLGREFEEMCAQMYYRGKMFGFVHLYSGQEARPKAHLCQVV